MATGTIGINDKSIRDLNTFKTKFNKLLNGQNNKFQMNTKNLDITEMMEYIKNKNLNQKCLYISLTSTIGEQSKKEFCFNRDTINRLSRFLERHTINKLNKKQKSIKLENAVDEYNSDKEVLQELISSNNSDIVEFRVKNLRLQLPTTTFKTFKTGGAYFNYIFKPDINIFLNKCGIYHHVDSKNYEDNCLFKALESADLNLDLHRIKHLVSARRVPIDKLSQVANVLDINIELLHVRNDNNHRKRVKKYPNKFNNLNPTVQIGLVNEHYFIIYETDYTSYFINNYAELGVVDELGMFVIEDANYVINKSGSKNKKRCLNSFKLVELLMNNIELFFNPINNNPSILETIYQDKFNNSVYGTLLEPKLDIDYKSVAEYKPKKRNFINKNLWTLDFETYADSSTLIHIPYLCVIRNMTDEFKYDITAKNYKDIGGECFFGANSGDSAVNWLAKSYIKPEDSRQNSIKVYIHNLKYDGIFLKEIVGLNIVKEIKTNSQLMLIEAYYYGHKIIFSDSLCLINNRLANFGKMFNLEVEKEVIPYSIYTKKNINRRFISLDIIKRSKEFKKQYQTYNVLTGKLKITDVKDTDKFNTFTKNATMWGCVKMEIGKNNKKKFVIDVLKYAEIYCRLDCYVLANGLINFNKNIETIDHKLQIEFNGEVDDSAISAFDYISISSLSFGFMNKFGAYDGCCSLGNSVRAFIQEAVVGGRTICANNEPQIQEENRCGTMIDYNSLYPSAMVAFNGYAMGIPFLIKSSSDLEHCSTYFIRIEIKKVGKNREMPCLSYFDEERKVRCFTNDMVGRVITIDKISLEQAVLHQKLEYSIIDGYGFNGGFNTNVNRVSSILYQYRQELKAVKNPLEQIVKLLMNSSYGKNLQKPIDDERKFVYNNKFIKKFNNDADLNLYLIDKKIQLNEDYYFTEIIKDKIVLKQDEADYIKDRYYNSIKGAIIINPKTGLNVITIYKPVNNHFNYVHLGCQILAESKRLMNDVSYLMDDNDIKCYYQDTDSIFMNLDQLKLLEELYRLKYEKELIGKGLGQLSLDFEIEGCNNIVAIKSIFIKKKCYVCLLKGVDDKTGELKYEFKIRCAGVNNPAIYHKVRTTADYDSPYDLYLDVYSGNVVEVDLTCDKYKDIFKFEDNCVRFNQEFIRSISRDYEIAKEYRKNKEQRELNRNLYV